ncbi:MAG: NapC/NirT family cytochrome c [Methanocellales archaeon]|nr:NapC/NirT family cytochrome c [Methanocellales archaeon]
MVSKRLNIIIVFIVLLAIAGFGALTMLHYTESPEFCAECHIMEPYYRSYLSSDYLDHKHEQVGITCDGCHIEPGTTTIEIGIHSIFAEVIPYYTGAYEDPVPPGHVPREHCLQCHEDYREKTRYLATDPHKTLAECDSCHQAHPKRVVLPPPSDEQCGQCHRTEYNAIKTVGGDHGRLYCTYCHETHGAILACQGCHGDTHGAEYGNCLDCHSDAHAPGKIAYAGTTSNAFCAVCHDAEYGATQTSPSKHTGMYCADCHAEHGAILACMDCHAPHTSGMTNADCLGCHPAHMPTVIEYPVTTPSTTCGGCHQEDYNTLMTSATRHATLTCAYCHPEHAYLPTCQSCHGTPHGATFTDCGTCHDTAHSTRI